MAQSSNNDWWKALITEQTVMLLLGLFRSVIGQIVTPEILEADKEWSKKYLAAKTPEEKDRLADEYAREHDPRRKNPA